MAANVKVNETKKLFQEMKGDGKFEVVIGKGNKIVISVNPNIGYATRSAITDKVIKSCFATGEYAPYNKDVVLFACILQEMTNLPVFKTTGDSGAEFIDLEKYNELLICTDLLDQIKENPIAKKTLNFIESDIESGINAILRKQSNALDDVVKDAIVEISLVASDVRNLVGEVEGIINVFSNSLTPDAQEEQKESIKLLQQISKSGLFSNEKLFADAVTNVAIDKLSEIENKTYDFYSANTDE